MKKRFIVGGFTALMALAVSAQIIKQDKPPAPPKAPKPPIEQIREIPPPPPPPAPVEPPLPPAPPIPPSPSTEEPQMPNDYEAFLQRNPSVKSLSWNKNKEIIFHLKSGKEERYKLDDRSIKEAELKYGNLPVAPPPPPVPPIAPPPPPSKVRTVS